MKFYRSYRYIILPLILVLAIWLVYWVEIRYHFNFNQFGVFPREFKGILGIAFSGFIHSGINHLYSNTLPLLILSSALAYFYPKQHLKVLLSGYLLTGVLTWLIARPSFHIGASGLIYFLASFLFFNGIKSKNYRLIALALAVVFVYGSLIWGTLPSVKDNVSWEGHLSGFLSGFLLSYFIRPEVLVNYPLKESIKRKETDFELEFMQQFDEHGNFCPAEVDDDHNTEEQTVNLSVDIDWTYDHQDTTSTKPN